MRKINWGFAGEVFVWLFAVYLLIMGIAAEDNSIESLKYFFFGFSLLIQSQIHDVARAVQSKSARVETMNVFLTKDEYEKSMLIHAEQKRPVNIKE